MINLELDVAAIIDNMSKEIANLIRQVHIKDAEIAALRKLVHELSPVERPEVTE